jgi:hypothetical protein
MAQSTLGTIISWIAFVFLIITGLESSRQFAEKIKTMDVMGFFELLVVHRLWYPIGAGTCLALAVFAVFSKPFSTAWTIVVFVSYVFILYILIKKLWRRTKSND